MKSIILLITIALFGLFQESHAQLSVCDICQTQVNTIQQYDFGSGSGFQSIGFQANVSGSPFCEILGFEWATSVQGAAITQDGSWCRIDFPQLGPLQSGGLGSIVQVCCTYSQWRDRNQNGIQDLGEVCSETLCIVVNL